MRTLLNESIPPFQTDNQTFSLPAPAGPEARTVSEKAVLATVETFSEVGVDGTAMATPSESSAPQANASLERGMAPSDPISSRAGQDDLAPESKAAPRV